MILALTPTPTPTLALTPTLNPTLNPTLTLALTLTLTPSLSPKAKPRPDQKLDLSSNKTPTLAVAQVQTLIVTTVLLSCQVADEGGGTTFSNANVFVRPRAHDAVLFSYYNSATGQTRKAFAPVRLLTQKVLQVRFITFTISTLRPSSQDFQQFWHPSKTS